ncbi:MAG: hypothetical protein QXY48_06465 [Sulfolobales archaeon]
MWGKIGSTGSPPSHCDKGHLDAVVEAKKKEVAVEKLIQELERVGYELRRPKCFKKC